jgi:hypothetical protein
MYINLPMALHGVNKRRIETDRDFVIHSKYCVQCDDLKYYNIQRERKNTTIRLLFMGCSGEQKVLWNKKGSMITKTAPKLIK